MLNSYDFRRFINARRLAQFIISVLLNFKSILVNERDLGIVNGTLHHLEHALFFFNSPKYTFLFHTVIEPLSYDWLKEFQMDYSKCQ